MGKRDFNVLNDILTSVGRKEEELGLLKDDLKQMKKGRLRRFFTFDSMKKEQFKLDKARLQGKITAKKDSIRELYGTLDKMCTFDFQVLVNFLVDVLSFVEGEQYQISCFDLCNSYSSVTYVNGALYPIPMFEDEDVCLITTKKNTNLVFKASREEGLDDSYDIEDAIEDNKYILLDIDEDYLLFDYESQIVSEDLTKNYPYLNDVVEDLMNVRFFYNDLTDEEVVGVILQQMPQRYSHLANDNGRRGQHNK